MLAGAVRAYLNRWAVAPRRAAVFTACDDGWRTAADLAAAGVEVTALVDARPDAALPAGPWRGFAGGAVIDTRGRTGLRAVDVRHARPDRDRRRRLAGGRRRLEPGAGADLPPRRRAGLGRRARGLRAGRRGGAGAAGRGSGGGRFLDPRRTRRRCDGGDGGAGGPRDRGRGGGPAAGRGCAGDGGALLAGDAGRGGRAWLDLQNDVTVKDVALAVRENYASPEHMKRYTTLGMATDQGKSGGVTALAVLSDLTGLPMDAVPPTTFRPPWMPVPIAALGAGGTGEGFAPVRLPPAHAGDGRARRRAGRGGALAPADGVSRSRARPTGGMSCDREVRMVRGRGRGLRRLDARQDRGRGTGCRDASSTGCMPTPSRRCRSAASATA